MQSLESFLLSRSHKFSAKLHKSISHSYTHSSSVPRSIYPAMAEEIAKLVGVLFDDNASSSSNDVRLRSEKLGLEALYSILKQGVEINSNGKLGLQLWDQAQIQVVISVAYAIVSSTRSISVEQVEPIIVAVMEQSLEFALCCLEKSVAPSDDISFIQVHLIYVLKSNDKDSFKKWQKS